MLAGKKFQKKSGSVFQMDGGKAKLSQFIFLELFSGDAVDLVFISREITQMCPKIGYALAGGVFRPRLPQLTC